MPVQLSNHGNTLMNIAVSSTAVNAGVTPQDAYAYTLVFPSTPPQVPALLQADETGNVTWASTALGRSLDSALTLQGKGMLIDASGGGLVVKTDEGATQTADSIVVQATGTCATSAIDVGSYLPAMSGCVLLEAPSGVLGGTAKMLLLESKNAGNATARLRLESDTETVELSTVSSSYTTGASVTLANGLALNCIDQPVQITSGAAVQVSAAKGVVIGSSANGIALTASNAAADVTLTAGQGSSGNMLLQSYNGYLRLDSGQTLQLNGGANGSVGGVKVTSHGASIDVTPDSAYPVNVTGNLVVTGTVTSLGQQLQAPPPTPHGVYSVVQNSMFPAASTTVVPIAESTKIPHLSLSQNTLTVNTSGLYSISVDHWRVSDYVTFGRPQWTITEFDAGYQQMVTGQALYGVASVVRMLNTGDRVTFNVVNTDSSKSLTVYAGGPGTNFHLAYLCA